MGEAGTSTSRGPVASGPAGGRQASLSKGAKWLGGIVVVAAVGGLTPVVIDSFKSPPEIGAKFDKVSIANPMTLDQFARRQRGTAFASLPGGAPVVRLVAYVADAASADAQIVDTPEVVPRPIPAPDDLPAEDTNTTPEDQPTDDPTTDTTTTPPEEEPGEEEPGEEDPGTTPSPPPLDTQTKLAPGDTVKANRDPVIPLDLEHKEVVKLKEGMRTALGAPGVPTDLDVPQSCEENPAGEDCGLSAQLGLADEQGEPLNVSTQKIATRLAEVFKGTRTKRIASAVPGEPATRQLVGVMVSYSLKLTGLRGSRARISWSLLSAGGSEVRDPWLVNRQVSVLAGKADTYTGGGTFWVPMPEERGPFYLRIEAADSDGQQLNFHETDRFR